MKKFELPEEGKQHLPISFNYIRYWKLSEEPERIDNYNDPFFDGLPSSKYQTSSFTPISHFKTISKIVDLAHLQTQLKDA